MLTGGLAAVLASTCCLGPLVLITLGISGAWISNLTLLEPYQPLFIGAAVVALFFAYRRIWRPAAECAPGQVCALPSVNRSYKLLFWIVVALLIRHDEVFMPRT
ncbi:MAG: mercuric transport protein MerT [Tibeticola sp.]